MPRQKKSKAALRKSLDTLMELQRDENPRVRLAAARAAGELAAKMRVDELQERIDARALRFSKLKTVVHCDQSASCSAVKGRMSPLRSKDTTLQ